MAAAPLTGHHEERKAFVLQYSQIREEAQEAKIFIRPVRKPMPIAGYPREGSAGCQPALQPAQPPVGRRPATTAAGVLWRLGRRSLAGISPGLELLVGFSDAETSTASGAKRILEPLLRMA